VGQFGLQNIGGQVVAIQLRKPGHPVFEEDSYEFTVDVTAEDGDDVGEPIAASDPDDDDTVTYSITAGNEDLDEDTKAAFAIDTSTGQITVNDADDLALLDVFNLTVTATDSKGLTDTTDVKVTVDSPGETDTPGIFSCSDLFKLVASITSVKIDIDVNFGIFFVDGADGNIDGVLPGAKDYAVKAAGRALSLLAVIAQANGDDNKGFNFPPGQLKKVLGLQSAAALTNKNFTDSSQFFFGFLSVKEVSIGDLFAIVKDSRDLKDLLKNIFLSTEGTDAVKEGSDGGFTLNLGGLTFSVTFDRNEVDDSLGGLLGIDLKGDDAKDEIIDEVIIKCDKDGIYKVKGSIFREAAFDNTIGFFLVDEDGDVLGTKGDKKGKSIAKIKDSLNDYKKAIKDNLIDVVDALTNTKAQYTVANNTSINIEFDLDIKVLNKAVYVLPVLAVQGGFSSNDIYYPIIAANKDTFDHMKFQGVSSGNGRFFGFEDLPNGGDNDFDDFIIQVNVSQVSAT